MVRCKSGASTVMFAWLSLGLLGFGPLSACRVFRTHTNFRPGFDRVSGPAAIQWESRFPAASILVAGGLVTHSAPNFGLWTLGIGLSAPPGGCLPRSRKKTAPLIYARSCAHWFFPGYRWRAATTTPAPSETKPGAFCHWLLRGVLGISLSPLLSQVRSLADSYPALTFPIKTSHPPS